MDKLPENVLTAVDDLVHYGWNYTYDAKRGVAKFSKGDYTIEADGKFKIVEVERTVLRQRVNDLQDLIDAIHVFAYAVDNNLVSIAKRWTDAIARIERAAWTNELLLDNKSLRHLESIADVVTNYVLSTK